MTPCSPINPSQSRTCAFKLAETITPERRVEGDCIKHLSKSFDQTGIKNTNWEINPTTQSGQKKKLLKVYDGSKDSNAF